MLSERFGWHPLDVEDIVSKRQRPKVDDYEGRLPLRCPPLPGLRQGDPAPERGRARRLPRPRTTSSRSRTASCSRSPSLRPLREDEAFREQLFAKGSGRLLYEVLDDLFDYCFPILDKIGHKLDSIEDDMSEGSPRTSSATSRTSSRRSSPTARSSSPSGRRCACSSDGRQVPARGARPLLRRHRRRRRADLGPARQLQGGRRGARGDERVGDLAPPERRPPRAHDLHRRCCCRSR